jgi:hypothetical protein
MRWPPPDAPCCDRWGAELGKIVEEEMAPIAPATAGA